MTFLRLLGLYATATAVKALKSTPALTWEEVQAWIAGVTDPDAYGRRYSNQKFTARRPDGYVEVRREMQRGKKMRVSAALFLGPRNQMVSGKTWEVEAIDDKLTKKFGDNLRFTIKV